MKKMYGAFLIVLVAVFSGGSANAVIWSAHTNEAKTFQICGVDSLSGNEVLDVADYVPSSLGNELAQGSVDWVQTANGKVHRTFQRFYNARSNKLVRVDDYQTNLGNLFSWTVYENLGVASHPRYPQGFLVQGSCVFNSNRGFQGFSDTMHVVVRNWKTNKIMWHKYIQAGVNIGRINNYTSKVYDYNGDGMDDIVVEFDKQDTVKKAYLKTIVVYHLLTGKVIKTITKGYPYANPYVYIP